MNNVEAFVYQSLLNDNEFNVACRDASLTEVDFSDMINNAFIFSLEKDSVVSPINSKKLGDRYVKTPITFSNSLHKVCDLKKPVDVDHVRG